ncbi:class I SAM-dependent RNA methyltransferase [Candidatus Peregrinibacteria bacterium]|nr:class I SAM-dependent RNA methyltransferase [Candidatus Peregrinibacteria bacterium]
MSQPVCPYFGTCGGCAMQHIDYAIQLENKKKNLAQAIGFDAVTVFSDQEYGYRNRMDMVFHPGGLGFRERQSWTLIVDVKQCSISNERLNALLKEILDFFGTEFDAFHVKKHTGTFRFAVIRTPKNDSCISFVLGKNSTRLDEAIRKIEAFARVTSADNVLATYMSPETDMSIGSEYLVIKGKDELKATYLGKTFWYSAQGFFQNNDVMAEKMHMYVHDLLEKYDRQWAHLLDLYGGVGTFGIINAELFPKGVTIVENFEGCVVSAKKNIQVNGITNAEAIVLDAMQLKKLRLPSPLFVITDPPRSGMHPKTVEQLKKLEPKVIIYVSCNVQELKKDVPKFRDYKIKSAAVFDFFPQTNHMESVVELVRK